MSVGFWRVIFGVRRPKEDVEFTNLEGTEKGSSEEQEVLLVKVV